MSNLEAMFEKEVSPVAPMEQINPETGEVVTTDLQVAPVTVQNMDIDWDAIEAAEEGISLQPVYWSPSQKGQSSRGVYQGTSTITKNDNGQLKEIPVALWLTRDGLYMNGGVSFMDNFANLEAGSPIIVKYLGKKKTGSGNSINDFDVKSLIVK